MSIVPSGFSEGGVKDKNPVAIVIFIFMVILIVFTVATPGLSPFSNSQIENPTCNHIVCYPAVGPLLLSTIVKFSFLFVALIPLALVMLIYTLGEELLKPKEQRSAGVGELERFFAKVKADADARRRRGHEHSYASNPADMQAQRYGFASAKEQKEIESDEDTPSEGGSEE